MNITLEKSDRDYLYIGIILLIIGLSVLFRVQSFRSFNESLKEKELTNIIQKRDIRDLKGSVQVLDSKAKKLLLVADSLQVSENKFKHNYYVLDKKFKASLVSYANSSDDDKWDAFTKAINE